MRGRGALLTITMAAALCTIGDASVRAQAVVALAQSQTAGGTIVLDAHRTQIPLVTPQANASAGETVAAALRTLPAGKQVYLKLQGVKSTGAPGVTYNVYLGLPRNEAGKGPADPHYLGSFSFFDAEGARDRAIAINITERLRRLAAEGKLGSGLTVTIAPAGQPTARARPQIDNVAIVAQ